VSEGMAVSPTSRPAGPRRRPAVLAWALWGLTLLALAAAAWLDRLLRQAGRSDLVQRDVEGATYAVLGLVSTATVGAVVASRRPANPVGWLLLAFGLLAITSLVAGAYMGRPGGCWPSRGRPPSPPAGTGRRRPQCAEVLERVDQPTHGVGRAAVAHAGPTAAVSARRKGIDVGAITSRHCDDRLLPGHLPRWVQRRSSPGTGPQRPRRERDHKEPDDS
jgi:hypothetical protein